MRTVTARWFEPQSVMRVEIARAASNMLEEMQIIDEAPCPPPCSNSTEAHALRCTIDRRDCRHLLAGQLCCWLRASIAARNRTAVVAPHSVRTCTVILGKQTIAKNTTKEMNSRESNPFALRILTKKAEKLRVSSLAL